MLNTADGGSEAGFPGIDGPAEAIAIDFDGVFSFKRSGFYTFRLVSDDGSILWIDDHEVVDNDGVHPVVSKIEIAQLESGRHRIRVHYFQVSGHAALQLFVTPPGEPERLWRDSI
ncbi:MAG: PA14 domain-containing protein [Polyangiaceae bacterium]|nr:PA14 domain-containing protein [Polyangiaceae bacterium]